jgi:hypothetical protein
MNGARFMHDELVKYGWEVLVADAQRVKGLAPVACKTDRVDARVLAVLSDRNLVKHKSMLKHRIHATLMTFGTPEAVAGLKAVGPSRRTSWVRRARLRPRGRILETKDRPCSRYAVGRADLAHLSGKGVVVLHVGLDLSRKRAEVCLISSEGELVEHFRSSWTVTVCTV